MYGKLRRRIGEILRSLCRQERIGIEESNEMPDYIQMLVSVPPKYTDGDWVFERQESGLNP